MRVFQGGERSLAHPVGQEVHRPGADGEIADVSAAIGERDVGIGIHDAPGERVVATIGEVVTKQRL